MLTHMSIRSTDVALMRFFGGLNTADTLPMRQSLNPRHDNRSAHVCRTIGDFAVYMHDFGFEHFDVNFREDVMCWNGTNIQSCQGAAQGVERGYTWWCNKRPHNPCVFNCPTQVRIGIHLSTPGTYIISPQVKECEGQNARPKEMVWTCGKNNTFPRWPNDTEWESAWDLQHGTNQTHVVDYYIPNGWGTNLVTNWSALGITNENNETLYEGSYYFQGAKLVHYTNLTREHGNFAVPGVFDGQSDSAVAYSDELANERHYWSTSPTNETGVYNTTFRVWGTFTTFTTHLSNHQELLDCHVNHRGCQNTTEHSRGRAEDINMMQCPFQFRCFTPEASAGSPGCHRSFPNDYEGVHINQTIHAGKFFKVCQGVQCIHNMFQQLQMYEHVWNHVRVVQLVQ